MICFRFLAKDARFDIVTGKDDKAKKGKRKEKPKSDQQILYLDGVPYKRIVMGPGKRLRKKQCVMKVGRTFEYFKAGLHSGK